MIQSWAVRFDAKRIFWSAGSPCQNLSKLQGSARAGLAGEKSALFWHVVRIHRLLKLHFEVVQ
eukprot:8296421-Karenia_brevis.AAC.1